MSLNKNTTLKSHRDQETVTVKTMLSLCASVCLSVYTSMCLSAHSCPCLYILVSVCTSVCLSVHLCTCLYIHVPLCTSVCLSVHPCTCLYIRVPVCTSVCLSYSRVPVCTFMSLSVHPCACLTPLCPTPPTFPVDFLICRLNCFFLNLFHLSRPCLCYFPETTKCTESTPFLSVNGLFPLVKNDQKWVQIPASFLTNLRVFYKVLF